MGAGGPFLCESSDDSEFELSQYFTPEEQYQQDQKARKKAKKAAKEARKRAASQPVRSVAASGVKPPLPPLPTKNRFGALEEVVKPPKSYADFVREQERSRPPTQTQRPMAPPGDALSPVPGLSVALVPEKPGNR